MIKLGKLDTKTLTVKHGMFNKKLKTDDEISLKFKNPIDSVENLNGINFHINENTIEEGVFGIQDNKVFFKLRPTQLHMPNALGGSRANYSFWTNSACFAVGNGSISIKLENNKLPFLLTNVFGNTNTYFSGDVYECLCHGHAWDSENLSLENRLKEAKKFVMLFLNAAPNNDLAFRKQYRNLSTSMVSINRYYTRLTELHKDIKTPEEAAEWYRVNGDKWLNQYM